MDNGIKVEVNRCGCPKPETCYCDNWVLTVNGEVLARHYDKGSLDELASMILPQTTLAHEHDFPTKRELSNLIRMAATAYREDRIPPHEMEDRLGISEDEMLRTLSRTKRLSKDFDDPRTRTLVDLLAVMQKAIVLDGVDSEYVEAIWLNHTSSVLRAAATQVGRVDLAEKLDQKAELDGKYEGLNARKEFLPGMINTIINNAHLPSDDRKDDIIDDLLSILNEAVIWDGTDSDGIEAPWLPGANEVARQAMAQEYPRARKLFLRIKEECKTESRE